MNYRLEKAVEPIVQRLEKEKTAIEETLRKDGELYGELKIDAKEIEKTKFKTTLRKSATTAYNAWRDSEKRNEQRLDSLQRLIIEYNNPNDRKRLSLKRQMSLENDFTPLDDYKVLGEINRLDSDKNFISWVMTLLFLILEMAPFMYKSLDLDGEFVWISQNIAQKVHLNLVNPKQQVTYNEEKNETKPISVTEPKREQATYFTFSKNGIGS